MKRWNPINYREFYDIPRIFLTQTEKGLLLFDCEFDPEKDDYRATYKVYLMPGSIDDTAWKGSWEQLPERATKFLGDIPTTDVEFDPTLRRQINAEILGRFGY